MISLNPRVGIVLVNFNGAGFLNDCVGSLKKLAYNNFQIVVVDNASTDNSIAQLLREYPELPVIRSQENQGITGGNNLGIEYCLQREYDFVLLLNNDTVVTPDFLGKLVDFSIKNDNCLCVPKIYLFEDPKRINNWIGEFDFSKGETRTRYYGQLDQGQFSRIEPIKMSSTCALLIHQTVFKKIGLMDQRYFMYYDDTDFVYRAISSGFKMYFIPDAIIYHKESSSAGKGLSPLKLYYGTRNQLLFVAEKCDRKLLGIIFIARRVFTGLIFILKSLLKGRFNYIKIFFMAIADFRAQRFYKKSGAF